MSIAAVIVSPGVKVPPHAIAAPLDEVKPMVREEAMAAPAMLPPKDSPITSGRLHPTRLEYEAEGWTRSEIAAKRYMAASDGWGYWYMWAWALPFPET